jgi:RNA polymerase sigma factor (sigma-70 family)
MATAQFGTLRQHIHRLAPQRGGAERTDRQLLDHFAACGDGSAFAELVGRHGPMVLRVCRRVLRHEQDAEDAFQATFLVLARHHGSIRRREAVVSWLHGVAYRTAMKAKRSAARRRNHEARASERTPLTVRGPAWDDVQEFLHREVQSLPERYRAAFVLCVLDGKTVPAAAAELAVPVSTLSCRLGRARQRLRQRLARRGIELPAVLAALSLAAGGEAAVPAALAGATVRFGLSVAAGSRAAVIPAHIAALAAGVTRAMFLSKAKITTALLVVCLIAAGAGVLAHQAPAATEPPAGAAKSKGSNPRPERAAPKPPAVDDQRDSVEVCGRVLDPDGNPAPGAKVVFHQRRPRGQPADFFPGPLTGTTDADGRFRFVATVHFNAPANDNRPMLTVTAHLAGRGPAATVETGSPDELKECTLRLVPDDVPIRGRVLNLEGKPVAGITVRPVAVVGNAVNDLSKWAKAIETDTWSDLPRDQRTEIVFSAAAAGLTQTAMTDKEGRFALTGIGRERIVVLRLDGPGIATCLVNAMTSARPAVRGTHPVRGRDFQVRNEPLVYAYGATFDYITAPPMLLEGTVSDQDTGTPLAGALVRQQIAYDFGWAEEELTATTDASGHYVLNGLSRSPARAYQGITFALPAGARYLRATFPPTAPEVGKPAKLDVKLKRGALVKGRVTDKATGKPVQAVVEYFTFADNPHVRGVRGLTPLQTVSSKKDGTFTLAILPGRGILAAKTDEMRRGMYLHGQGADTIAGLDARIGGFNTRPHGCLTWQFNTFVGINVDDKAESVACDLQLHPSKTVKGTILGPDGRPLAGATISGPFGSGTSLRDLPSAAFTLPTVNPHKAEAYFFEHRKKNLAAAVIVKGDEGEGLTVKLQPAATITGRVVTEDGEPVCNTSIIGRIESGQLNITRPWLGFFWGRTDADGRFKIEGVHSGVKFGAFADQPRGELFASLTFGPGEVRDLGTIKVKKVPE